MQIQNPTANMIARVATAQVLDAGEATEHGLECQARGAARTLIFCREREAQIQE